MAYAALWLTIGVLLIAMSNRRAVEGPWMIVTAVAWLVAGGSLLLSVISLYFLLPLVLLALALLALTAGWTNLFKGLVFIAGLPGTILLVGTIIS